MDNFYFRGECASLDKKRAAFKQSGDGNLEAIEDECSVVEEPPLLFQLSVIGYIS